MNRKRSRRRPTKGVERKMRQEWTAKEDTILYNTAEGSIKKKPWSQIVDEVYKKAPKFKHGTENCMRRYKHYINPSWHNNSWPMGGGFFLALCAKVYGYKWEKLEKVLQIGSPALLKEYFYSYVYKVIRHFSKRYMPLSVLHNPEHFFEWACVMDEIQSKYIPAMAEFDKSKGSNVEDATVLSWLKGHRVRLEKFKDYRKIVAEKFKETQGKAPISIIVDLEKAEIKGKEAEELVKAEPTICESVKGLIIVKFGNKVEAPIEVHEVVEREAKFKFPVYRSMLPLYIPKRPFPEPSMMYPPQVGFQPPQPLSDAVMRQCSLPLDVSCGVPSKRKAVDHANQP